VLVVLPTGDCRSAGDHDAPGVPGFHSRLAIGHQPGSGPFARPSFSSTSFGVSCPVPEKRPRLQPRNARNVPQDWRLDQQAGSERGKRKEAIALVVAGSQVNIRQHSILRAKPR